MCEELTADVLISHHTPSDLDTFERSDPRFRSGQTHKQIPSNAWARKIAALTKPITAVIVSNIANVPLCPGATENGGDLAQSKGFSGHQHTIPIDRGFCATDVHRLVIQRWLPTPTQKGKSFQPRIKILHQSWLRLALTGWRWCQAAS